MNNRKSERGAVAVIVAMCLLVLTGIAAIVLDGGLAYNERRSSQNTADNTAIAAAWADCTDVPDPIDHARQIHMTDGYSAAQVGIAPVEDSGFDVAYRVTITVENDTTFARTIGASEVTVVSEATAACDRSSGGGAAAMFAKGPGCQMVKGGKGNVAGFVYSAGNMTWNGGGSQTIAGSIHSDGSLTLNGGPPAITGSATASSGPFNPPVTSAPVMNLPYPVDYRISDFVPGSPIALAAGGDYHDHGTGNIRASDIDTAGIHYIDGNVTHQGGGLGAGHVTIIATGTVTINSANITSPYHEGLAIMAGATTPASCDTAIDIGGNGTINGILFAPNGQLEVHGGAVNGGMIAWSIVTGGNLVVAVDADLFPGADPEVLLLE